MDGTPNADRLAPQDLRSELERSRDDLVAGRIRPLRAVLTAMHGRASGRLERQVLAVQEQDRGLAEPG